MEVAMPMSGTAIDCYEDMFKEITRKLYGEEGLPELTSSSSERLPATTAGTSGGGSGSGSQDRGLTPIDYDVDNAVLKPEEHLTAFGLAALMQNGFPAPGILNSTFHQPHKVMPTNNPAASSANTSPAASATATTTTSTISSSLIEDKWTTNDDLMPWTQSKIASYNPAQRLFRCTECDCTGYLARVAEHWLGTHSNLRAFQCPQCPYESAWARCVRMHLSRQHNINVDDATDTISESNHVMQEITKYLQRLKSRVESSPKNQTIGAHLMDEFQNSHLTPQSGTSAAITDNTNSNSATSKRYSCTYCPYATDRRDLFTRHENIHREEKPFQCYVCQKQFNRADHVKKHFLRMHREHPYDLNRIRRHPPKNASGMSYYQKYNANSNNSHTDSMAPALNNTINSLSIPNSFNNNMARNQTHQQPQQQQQQQQQQQPPPPQPSLPVTRPANSDPKTNKQSNKGTSKKKGEKRFTCCYCSWSGVDNWCLKRHMNTHLKPFVCGLCDYKAARSERLATHVLKVHNKRACSKCTFLADDAAQLAVHQQEQHPLEHRNRSVNILRNTSFNTSTATSCSQNSSTMKIQANAAAVNTLHQTGRAHQIASPKVWKGHHVPKQHGAARLFNYMEASDGSEPESESRGPGIGVGGSGVGGGGGSAEDMSRMSLNHRIQSDFLEAGDAGSQAGDYNYEDYDAERGGDGEVELPLFVCETCGCEFEDDTSLDTHRYTHRHSTASPAKLEHSKENVNPNHMKYICRLCDVTFESQSLVMAHMLTHSTLTHEDDEYDDDDDDEDYDDDDDDDDDDEYLSSAATPKRARKQSQPKKMVPHCGVEQDEHHSKSKQYMSSENDALWSTNYSNKYIMQAMNRKGLYCTICKDTTIRRYHSRASLALHMHWKHLNQRYQCEHCDKMFRHQYQCVLHASREHIDAAVASQTVPNKEPIIHSNGVVAAGDQFYAQNAVPEVADAASSTDKSPPMPFLEQNFLHNSTISGSSINSKMPIVIPTFPLN